MKTQKRMTFEYFRIRIHNNIGSGLYDLRQWINKMDDLSLEERKSIIRGYPSRLETCEPLDKRYVHLRFMKMTDSFLPELAKDNEESVPLELEEDEYIAYDVNTFFDTETCVLMVQNNKGSLSAYRIKDYILQTGRKFDIFTEDDTISFECIKNQKELSFFKKTKMRKMEIRFDNLKSAKHISDNESSISSLLKTVKNTGGNTAVLTIGLGKGKSKDFLDNDTSEAFLEEALSNDEYLSGARVYIKEDDEIRTYDLLDNVLRDIWCFVLDSKTSLSYITVREKMLSFIKRNSSHFSN